MIAALLLAAGTGRRFGSDKTFASLADGTPLAVASLRALRYSVAEVVAVVRAASAVTPQLAAEGARIAVIDEPAADLGRSIAAGVASLMASEAAITGCIIAFADRPAIRRDTIARLAAALRSGHTLVVPEYRGTRGHPVACSAKWLPRLLRLSGDDALNDLLAVHREELLRLRVDDPGILADVDRPTDLEMLLDDQ